MKALDMAIKIVGLIVDHTTCPDPGEGGCIGGPIPGYGCVHETARSALQELHGMRERMVKAPGLLLDLTKQPGRAVGLRVRTPSTIDPKVGDYVQPRAARPNATGIIEGYSDSHGLCFNVKHDDPDNYGTTAGYDPDELTIIYER